MRLSYKRGTALTLSDLGDRWHLTLHQEGWDAENHCTRYIATYTQAVEKSHLGIGSSYDLAHWIRRTIQKFELHEVDEWLRIDGERVFNPHGEGVDPDGYDPLGICD